MLNQVRSEVFVETPDFADRIARVFIPDTGPIPKACLVTVDNGGVIVYTLDANDPALGTITKTKVTERSF